MAYEDANRNGENLQKGFFFTKMTAFVISALVVTLLIAEGLIIGLVGRIECEVYTPIEITARTTTTRTTTTSASTTTEQETVGPWTSYRMPLNLIPYEYEVSLRPVLDPDENDEYIFKGSSLVRYACNIKTNYIILHSRLLEYQLNNWKLTKIDGTEVILKRMFFYNANDYVILETEQSCVEGEDYELQLSDFKGYLRMDNIGFYRSGYVNSNGEYIVIATTQMESTGARKAFPCFDEPAFKAKFVIQLWHKTNSNYFSLSNMPIDTTQVLMIEGEQWTGTTFQQTVIMQTYLVAMVVSDFEYYIENSTSKGVQIKVYARPEYIRAGDGDYTAMITPPAMEFFEEYIGVPYPLPKSDQISVPDFFAGAMENWGLVIYRESAMLYNDTTTSDTNKIYITNVIAHELAHQWFGNLVTCEWWDQTWLNEGFSTYYAYIGEEAVQPTWEPTKRFILDEMRPALKADELTTSRPMVQDVNADANIQQMFDMISYNKGGCVVRMVQNFMGEENFGNATREYLLARQYDVANQDQLFYYLEKYTSHLSLPTEFSTILETWTLQMGFPLVTVFDVDPLTNIFRVNQEYYLRDGDANPTETAGSLKYGYKWYIPFTFKRGSNLAKEAELVWLTPDQPVSLTETDFILGNSEVKGFFRVNYDRDSWDRISNRLDSIFFKDIPEENRAQLLDDAFAFASSGRLDPVVPIEMSNYLHRDTSYMAWGTFYEGMKYYEYMFGRTEVFGTFKNYVLELIVPSLYNKYGWEDGPRTDDKLLERQTRAIGIRAACYYEYPDCVQTAVNYFNEWMASPDDWGIMPTSYRDDILCTAIRAGGTVEWNFAWRRYVTSSPSWQSSLRYGLSCSKDAWILNRYLEYTFDPSLIRGQDASSLLQYVGGEEYGRDVAWAFLVNNYKELSASFGASTLSSFVNSIVRRFSTEYDRKLLEDFKETTSDLGTLLATINSAIATTNTNIKWRADNEESLTQWFYNNV